MYLMFKSTLIQLYVYKTKHKHFMIQSDPHSIHLLKNHQNYTIIH